MGGNAIKSSQRLNKEKFQQLTTELKELFPELKMEVVKFYRNKTDFGDIDIVVEKNKDLNIKKLVIDRLNPSEIYDNNMFFSFEYKSAQIDFIFMSSENFDVSLDYFSWNDLGNLIGRVSRSLNFKYGHDGLFYTLRLGDHYKNDICISKNTKDILTFLGYDARRWEEGFDNVEDIFEFALNTPYFNSLYFDLEEQAHNDRVRNRKRKMYQKFLEFIQERDIQHKPKLSQEERYVHYERAREVFGDDFHKIVLEETKKYEENLEYKKYINGNIVNELTGLENKELGKFMNYLNTEKDNIKDILFSLNENKKTEFANFAITDYYRVYLGNKL